MKENVRKKLIEQIMASCTVDDTVRDIILLPSRGIGDIPYFTVRDENGKTITGWVMSNPAPSVIDSTIWWNTVQNAFREIRQLDFDIYLFIMSYPSEKNHYTMKCEKLPRKVLEDDILERL